MISQSTAAVGGRSVASLELSPLKSFLSWFYTPISPLRWQLDPIFHIYLSLAHSHCHFFPFFFHINHCDNGDIAIELVPLIPSYTTTQPDRKLNFNSISNFLP
jgi:hypothetical protein